MVPPNFFFNSFYFSILNPINSKFHINIQQYYHLLLLYLQIPKLQHLTLSQQPLLNKYTSQPINIIEEEYLNYVVTQNTKYSDLEKIGNQYRILSVQRFNFYNKNKSLIAKLQKINNILTSQIQSSLITYFQLSLDDFLINYNNKIQQMKRLVKIKGHEQKTYKTLYNRLYYNNILLNKRIHSELEYADIYKTQHTKYKILKNHALLSFSSNIKNSKKRKILMKFLLFK